MKTWDTVGLLLSGLCVVHCLAMPFALLFLPFVGLEWLAGPQAHYWLLGLGVFVGSLSFLPGYRQHRRLSIPLLALCGLATMAYAARTDGEDCCTAGCCRRAETLVQECAGFNVRRLLPKSATPFGAALLLTAHIFNRRCRKSGKCPSACCAVSDA